MREALKRHWPEYLIEAAGLGIFMLSACMSGGGRALLPPDDSCADRLEHTQAGPFYGCVRCCPGSNIHHRRSAHLGHEYEPRPRLWLQPLSTGVDGAVDLFLGTCI